MTNSTERAVRAALKHKYKIWRIVREYQVTREQVREIKRRMNYERRRLAMNGAVTV
jgi:hypothetical protein